MENNRVEKTNEKKVPDMDSLVIGDVDETFQQAKHYVDFNANDSAYCMLIAEDFADHPNHCEILMVDHKGTYCSFCGSVRNKTTCDVLSEQALALYEKILPHSKNRLRWLNKHVFF